MIARCQLVFLCLVVAAGASEVRSGTQNSVVQKVIEMLGENKMKIAADLSQEEKEMGEYANYCDDESREKARSIKSADRKINDLNAAIMDGKAQVDDANAEIAKLGTEMASKEKDLAALAAQRAADKANFQETEKELMSAVDELDTTVVMYKREMAGGFLQTKAAWKKPAGKALMKQLTKVLGSIVDAAWVGESSTKVLKGFLEEGESANSEEGEESHQLARALQGAKKAAAHEEPAAAPAKEEGGGMVTTLEDMKTKAEETLSAARMEEMKSNHNYQMLKQSLVDALSNSKEKLSDANTLKASQTEAMGKANGELADVKKTKLTDEMYLDELKHDCTRAQEDWETRQSQAKGEMTAIDKAIDILTAGVKSMMQVAVDPDDTADDDFSSPQRKKLVSHLRDLGHRFNSYALAELASAAAADPLGKIRDLLEGMIAKLVAQANEEASQKAFCDEEKAKSGKEKDAKSMRVDTLANRIETAHSAQDALRDDIKKLDAEIAEIDAATKEATRIRSEEEATNTKQITDYKSGAEACENAVRVLKDYYSSVKSLAQVGSKQPKLGGASSGSGGAIISMLDNMGAEFTKMYMEVEQDEQEAAEAYKKQIADSKLARVSKKTEAENAESEIKTLEVQLKQNGEDMKMTNKELDAVMDYIEKLKPQCETKVMTHEEKMAKQQAEIDGLKEALSILDSAALVQAAKVHKH